MFKKGNIKVDCLTSIVCKTMEKIIRNHVIEHMQNNNLFNNKQFDFISGPSTMLQLLKVLNIWTEAIECGFSFDVIDLYFMKAFNVLKYKISSVAGRIEQFQTRSRINDKGEV